MTRSILAFFVALALPSAATVTIDWVTVGDINNAADPATGYGTVGHDYNIGKYEVTLGQYTEFLNATAASDPYGLYNPNMATNLNIAGISRSGSDGSYSYALIGSAEHPVTYVSWFDAARFANWIHNGQGSGSTEIGAYNLNGAITGTFIREVTAKVWIPTENEWYKAAYYDPTTGAGGGDNYWPYPTQSDSVPGNVVGDMPNNANYQIFTGFEYVYSVTQSDYSASQNYLTDVGSFPNSRSYYGTFDQGGSVFEWNDAIVYTNRGVRGGSWGSYDIYMSSSTRLGRLRVPTEYSDTGFRLAAVPEPCVGLLGVTVGGCALFGRRRPAS